MTLSTLQPVDGIPLMTTLTDIDGVGDNSPGTVTLSSLEVGQVHSPRRASTPTSKGTAASSYTPKPADVNHYLRATATYTDPQGSGKTAVATTANKVLVDAEHEHPPCVRRTPMAWK